MTGIAKQLLQVLFAPAPSLYQHQPPTPQPLLHLHPPQYLLHLGVFKTVHGMNQAVRLAVHLMERAGAMEYLVMPKERLWPGMTGTAKTQMKTQNPPPRMIKDVTTKKSGILKEASLKVLTAMAADMESFVVMMVKLCDGMNLTVIPSRRIENHKLLPLTISLAI